MPGLAQEYSHSSCPPRRVLWKNLYDTDGQPIWRTSFMTYLIPTAMEVPKALLFRRKIFRRLNPSRREGGGHSEAVSRAVYGS